MRICAKALMVLGCASLCMGFTVPHQRGSPSLSTSSRLSSKFAVTGETMEEDFEEPERAEAEMEVLPKTNSDSADSEGNTEGDSDDDLGIELDKYVLEAKKSIMAQLNEERKIADRTSGVGGVWKPPEKNASTYKPSKSGSWGLFERPKDISTTYGGGKKVGIGGYQSDPEELAKREAATKDRLKKYRKDIGADPITEKQNEKRILRAMDEARVFMARGLSQDAVEKLDEVVPLISYASSLGGRCYIELGMACEAAGNSKRAKEIYVQLEKINSDSSVKKQAKQLCFGFEAIEFLKIDEATEASKISRNARAFKITSRAWAGEYFDKSYDATYVNVGGGSSSKHFEEEDMKPVGSFNEARSILLAAVAAGRRRDVLFSSKRVLQALKRIARERGGKVGATVTATVDNMQSLKGEWKLVLSTGQGNQVTYTDARRDDLLTRQYGDITSGRAELVQVNLPFSTRAECSGDFALDTSTWQLSLKIQEARIGPIALPVMPQIDPVQVLTVDDQIYVTMARDTSDGTSRYEVWVRN